MTEENMSNWNIAASGTQRGTGVTGGDSREYGIMAILKVNFEEGRPPCMRASPPLRRASPRRGGRAPPPTQMAGSTHWNIASSSTCEA